ncbi:hypothetical protein Plhal304r1_c018g0064211 [Plasmopara halstedii]
MFAGVPLLDQKLIEMADPHIKFSLSICILLTITNETIHWEAELDPCTLLIGSSLEYKVLIHDFLS